MPAFGYHRGTDTTHGGTHHGREPVRGYEIPDELLEAITGGISVDESREAIAGFIKNLADDDNPLKAALATSGIVLPDVDPDDVLS